MTNLRVHFVALVLLASVGCMPNGVPSRSSTLVPTSSQQSRQPEIDAASATLMDALAAHLDRKVSSMPMVVAGMVLTTDSIRQGPMNPGRLRDVPAIVIRFATAASALIDPATTSGSPWEQQFLSTPSQRVLHVTLFAPSVRETDATVRVIETVLREGAPPGMNTSIWEYEFGRPNSNTAWQFVRESLVSAF